jgi:hypothetical protein
VVHVVVPAHDEQALLPACLRSVAAAGARLRRERPATVLRVTVVADRCSDSTADLATAAGADVVEVAAGCVGDARNAGVRRAAELAAPLPPERVWLALTDADTVVPEHWLTRQVELATEGHAMVVGTVRPDHRDLDPATLRAWHEAHTLGEGHPYVHGANLGLTLAAAGTVGGFPPVDVGEDVLLVEAVRRAGLPWCATATTQVVTSARRHGRVVGGFAGYLRALQEDGPVFAAGENG